MEYPEGSTWKKWDLHVHTPASLVQNYGGDREEVWDKFLQDIESLPPEFKVLGINDYIFIDGYKRVLREKQNGRLQNIDLLLPVIEFRLDKFGGSESRLNRVNYHVIFSEEVLPDTIQNHFLNALSNSYILSPEYEESDKAWSSNITRESLQELGQHIIDTTPEDKRDGNISALQSGFNNINFKLDDIQAKLKFHHFQDKYLIAVGKTEWAEIRWNKQAAAEKKHVVNGAHMLFSALETPDEWNKAK